MKMRLMLTFCAALALTVGVSTASAGGGNSDNAKKCQQGGYVNYSTTDGKPFNNVGDCVSYAAQGGTLVPLPDLQLSVSCTPTLYYQIDCVFHVKNAGIAPATGLIEVTATLQFVPPGGYVLQGDANSGAPDCTGPGNSTSFHFDPGPPVAQTADAVCDGTIPPGATADVLSVEVRGSGSESFLVNASVDPTNVVLESNENNNTYSATFS